MNAYWGRFGLYYIFNWYLNFPAVSALNDSLHSIKCFKKSLRLIFGVFVFLSRGVKSNHPFFIAVIQTVVFSIAKIILKNTFFVITRVFKWLTCRIHTLWAFVRIVFRSTINFCVTYPSFWNTLAALLKMI